MDAYAEALGLTDAPKAVKPARASAAYDPWANLPPAQAGSTGNFVGNPDDVIAGIASLRDPQERANAKAAFEAQMRANGGKLPPAKDPYAEALGIGAPSAQAAQPTSTQLAVKSNTITSPEADLTAHAVSSIVAPIGAGLSGGAKFLSSLLSGKGLDASVNAGADTVRSTQDALTYRPRTEGGQKLSDAFDSPYNPLTWIPRGASYVGEKAGGTLTDAGAPGAGALVEGAANAAPMLLPFAPKGVRLLRDLGKVEEPAARIDPYLDQKPRYRLENGQPVLVPQQTPTAQPAAPVAVTRPAAQTPRSGAQPTQEAPPIPNTPEALQAVAEKAPSSLFPETPTTAPQGGFTRDQQLNRAKILESVGVDPNKLRRSALTGDGTAGSTDFQTAKLDTPAGREMRAIIEGEKTAITNHADSLVAQTGGTHGIDQSALYARGNTILAPLDALKQWFDNRTSALYKAADERAQGVPTNLSNFSSVLNDASELTNSDRVHLQGAVNAYIKKLGMASDDGSIAGNAQQAETIRKYLNEQWSPQNSRLVGKLKDALDEDVTSAAGSDIYSEGRQIRALRGQTLDNPNGIAKLMDSSGPEGVNRSVPVEKIADSLTGMPVDQFSHVIKTLRESPPELQSQSQAALNEIKAQFANKVHSIGSSQQGQWNAKGVTKYLQNNAARMAQVFTPEEMAQFRNLNDAGHILAKDQSYPGAAVQGHNLVTQGVATGLPAFGAAVGGFVAGPPGAAVGSVAGRMAGSSVENAAAMKAVKNRTVKLSDLLEAGK
jgi:hypothetical protein